MNFFEWIISEESKISIALFANDGRIVVYVDGKRHTYVTDAMYHKKWKKQANNDPFMVLKQIKQQIKDGIAFEL